MKTRLAVIGAFAAALLTLGLLALDAGVLPGEGSAQAGTAPRPHLEQLVATLDWSGDEPLGLAANQGAVVWERREADGRSLGFWSYDVAGGGIRQVLAGGAVGRALGPPSMSGALLVWNASGVRSGRVSVHAYDTDVGRLFVPDAYGRRATITRGTIAWVDWRRAGRTLVAYDPVTGDDFTLATDVRPQAVLAARDWAAWLAGPARRPSVWAARRGDRTRYLLARRGSAVAMGVRRIVWATPGATGASIFAWIPGSAHSTLLWKAPAPVTRLVAGNGLVAWAQGSNGGDIWAYDAQRGTAIPVCTAAGEQTFPVIVGRTVFWADDRSGRWELYSRTLM